MNLHEYIDIPLEASTPFPPVPCHQPLLDCLKSGWKPVACTEIKSSEIRWKFSNHRIESLNKKLSHHPKNNYKKTRQSIPISRNVFSETKVINDIIPFIKRVHSIPTKRHHSETDRPSRHFHRNKRKRCSNSRKLGESQTSSNTLELTGVVVYGGRWIERTADSVRTIKTRSYEP